MQKVLCKVPESEREALKEMIEASQPLLKLIQQCCKEDIEKMELIKDDDYTNPAFPTLRAYKDGVRKGLTKLLEYVIIYSEN